MYFNSFVSELFGLLAAFLVAPKFVYLHIFLASVHLVAIYISFSCFYKMIGDDCNAKRKTGRLAWGYEKVW